MEALMVQLIVEAEHLDSFLEASKEVARASVHNEPGCRRFDIMQDLNVPTRVAFVEVFDDDAAVTAHPKFEHYPKWRAATADGNLAMGQWERVLVRRSHSLFPNNDANFDSAIAGMDESFLSGSLHIVHAALPVKPERVNDFINAVKLNALGSVHNEPGCLRFDVHQTRKLIYEDHAPTTPVDDPSLLWLYEVYANQEAFQYHTTTPHMEKWAETVKDWYVGELPPAYRGRNIWPPDNWGWSSGKPRE